jgi:hypothetical protein
MPWELHQPIARRDRVRLPAARAHRHVTGHEVPMRRGNHFAYGLTGHHVAGVHRLCVGLLLAQPPSHIGVDRQPDGTRHHLTSGGLRYGVLTDLEILPARLAVRAVLQYDRAADRRILAHRWLHEVGRG